MLGNTFLLGLLVSAGGPLGAMLGLSRPISSRLLGLILAFGAGALIAAVAIELGAESAAHLVQHDFGGLLAWLIVAGGFLAGAGVYTAGTHWLDARGGAIRNPFRLRQTLEAAKRARAEALFEELSRSGLFAQLPPEEVSSVADCAEEIAVEAGQAVFNQGDEGDALYVILSGQAEVVRCDDAGAALVIATLGAHETFGEMALLSGEARTATVSALTPLKLVRIAREDFNRILADNGALAAAVARIAHDRALSNISRDGQRADGWARIASENTERLSRREFQKGLHDSASGTGAGAAILLGNFLDMTPAAFAIGANFHDWSAFSLPLALGIFIADVPESATSSAMMRRAGFRRSTILLLWLLVMAIAGVSAVLGQLTLGVSFSPLIVVSEAFAGGAVLALVSQTMVPHAMEEGGPIAVLPLVAGFLLSLGVILSGNHP